MDSKSDNMFEVTSFKQNHIEGNINIEQDQAHVLFTIPYDAQWKIFVDGQEVEAQSVLSDTLMAIPMNQGYHEVELVYFPRSIIIGLIASGVGTASLIILSIFDKRKMSDKPKGKKFIDS